MTGPAPLLVVEGLEIVYAIGRQRLHAIRKLEFSLMRGEVLGLVGESGSGKSTVALAIAGYLPESASIVGGSIRFEGADLGRLGEAERRRLRGRRIAIVYQDPASALNPSMRIGHQIAEIFRLHFSETSDVARSHTIEILERVRIPDAEVAYDRYPHEFSGGQQQRIVIAMALAGDPDLLILDEPTTGLDATVEAEILDLFEELRASLDSAFLYISHDITLIERMCDRVGVLYQGLLVEIGQSGQILKRPSHPYTQALISCVIPFGADKGTWRVPSIEGTATGSASSGCPFAPRCPLARSACHEAVPPLSTVAEGQCSRCLFPDEAASLRLETVVPRSAPPDLALPSGPLLELDHLGKTYRVGHRHLEALIDASVTLKAGAVLGVIGESGSGKSTLARLVAGLIVPTRGRIRLAGQDVTGIVEQRTPAQRRSIQMVFQNPDLTLNPRRSIGAALRRSVRKLGGLKGRDVDCRVDDLMRAVRLEPQHLWALPSMLSGGQRQRVAIARAFAANPDLVLCDEPTSALDVSVRAAVLNLLADLQRDSGTAYVYISHDLATVRYLADSVVVVYLGEIVAIGPAEAVFRAPLHPYCEALLSAVRTLGAARDRPSIRARGPAPSALDRPSGCPFHVRCPRKVGPECENAVPWQDAEAGHRYRCVIPPSQLRRLQMIDYVSPLTGVA